ncbi:cytidylate kinase [Scopulibacillus darangshiensis]|uniref:Cytidylate kinase n=1 Tax=Scopulibacillus darangshiensis TaxID=442528 RepID=A0A4R2P9Q0_9BACL|nr:(d)CMP kinase [Scopulibacillus darangshiensis]TCP31662.1 cytidylate kinase [Scopulibacillus darangshiensis]
MEKKFQIAIDGPAAAGKSTVAKHIADQLSYIYIDTGAMYRAITYKALQEKVDLHKGQALQELLTDTTIKLIPTEQGQRVLLDGRDVSDAIRFEDVTNHVSLVSQHQEVREELVRRQRLMADQGGVVMDGRDIGTHVLPNAKVKIFLRASVDERAERRYREQQAKGIQTPLEQLKNDIALRDKKDSEREVSPLVKAADAVEIDTTSLSISEVITRILDIVKERV